MCNLFLFGRRYQAGWVNSWNKRRNSSSLHFVNTKKCLILLLIIKAQFIISHFFLCHSAELLLDKAAVPYLITWNPQPVTCVVTVKFILQLWTPVTSWIPQPFFKSPTGPYTYWALRRHWPRWMVCCGLDQWEASFAPVTLPPLPKHRAFKMEQLQQPPFCSFLPTVGRRARSAHVFTTELSVMWLNMPTIPSLFLLLRPHPHTPHLRRRQWTRYTSRLAHAASWVTHFLRFKRQHLGASWKLQ